MGNPITLVQNSQDRKYIKIKKVSRGLRGKFITYQTTHIIHKIGKSFKSVKTLPD